VLPTTLILNLSLSLLPGLDPQVLRQELDTQPWRPAAVAAPLVVATVADTPAKVTAPSRAAVETPAAPATPTAAPEGPVRWRIQLAALGTTEQAQRERVRLEKALGAGTITVTEDAGKFKLRWGNFTSREAAEAAKADLKSRQIDGFTVRTASP
jgi:cell division septation protein DedD